MAKKISQKLAVVTGSNRGIGLEVCRQLARTGMTVILTARDEQKAEQAALELQKDRLMVCHYALDVGDLASVERLAAFITKRWGYLNVLVNNAGVLPDPGGPAASVFNATCQHMQEAFDVNCMGVFRVTTALMPLLEKAGGAQVVNVSSGLGQLSAMVSGFPAYRISKAALNALTRILAAEAEPKKVRVNAVCPGWVKTDMGGPDAERSVEEGASGIVWLATQPAEGPTGGFFRDREPLDW